MIGEMFTRERDRMSQWAIKRVCQFLLKKRLGDFILGDIDLDQLDVQLSQGTIHLSDLALNVDFLNLKLAGSAVVVKAGSIGSLSIRIPWRLQNCQIEVDGLELELMPARPAAPPAAAVANAGSMQGNDADKVDSDLEALPESVAASVSLDIHEGVKQIAKLVKWFLTSFQVRLKNMIVGFHPRLDADEKAASDFRRSIVLRIKEIEYGTCVSEDPKTDTVLGKAKLANFVKFYGAVVEFLKMDDVDCSLQENSCLGASSSECHIRRSCSGSTATVLSGAGGGFSGKLNLSIPWKNGSLDMRKVDADLSVDPVELSLQPNTIKWTIGIWESIKSIGVPSRSPVNSKVVDSPGSAIQGFDIFKRSEGSFSKSTSASVTEETFRDAVLPDRKVIHDYLSEKVETELEQDYGASIDQFFECFDGMRSSQAGSSGIWNWTCSVFNAITVASNLASGSGHIPIEQQNVETSLRANIVAISVSLSFLDEDSSPHDLMDGSKHLDNSYGAAHGSPHVNGQSSDPYMSCFSSLSIEQSAITDNRSISPTIHHLEARCQNLLFTLQICPQKTNFEASIMHFKVDEYHDCRNQAEGFVFPFYSKNSDEQLLLNHNLQSEIQASLPPFPFPVQDCDSEISVDKNAQKCQDGLIKVALLESFGICSCHCSIGSTDVGRKNITSTSFAVNLPPFILWIHFQLVNVLLDLFKDVENYFEEENAVKTSFSGVMKEQRDSSFLNGLKSDSSTWITTVSSGAHGKVLLPRARVILSLPSDGHGNFRNSTSLDKFIILELHPSDKDSFSFPSKNSPKGIPSAPSTYIHFGIGSFDLYLIDFARKNVVDNKSSSLGRLPHSAVKVLSGINKGYQHSGITMVCQKGPVTGLWMVSRAWSLASSQDQSRNKVAGKSCEFSSVTTGEDSEETSSHIRQELILSSTLFLHVHFSQIWINLDDHEYKLLNMVMESISNGICSTATNSSDCVKAEQLSPKVGGASQASIYLDCDALIISINLNEAAVTNPSIQKELEGPWNSFRLTIEKLQLLSVSNIGGVDGANFFWLNHGEGELWGSISDRNEKDGNEKAHNFLLISCRNSTVRRGDGKVANALSFGLAGTSVLYLRNPQLLQSYTSITVRSGTLVAPGGRMDWISAICFFFSYHERNETDGDDSQVESSTDGSVNSGSFFFDLVDVALSYEPHRNTQILKKDLLYSSGVEFSGEIGEQRVACLLAAASLSISNRSGSRESETINHTIQLKDLGLLICESSGSLNDNGGYYSSHLRKTGYVKVAQVALVEAVLRIKGMFWEVHCSDSHIILDTCQDTTNGLVRLVGQLQQLYAPDMEDALSHLQSRWNSIQRTHNDNTSTEVEDDSSVKSSSEMKLASDSDECILAGLLDEILENAFEVNGDAKFSSGCGGQSHSSLHRSMHYDNNTSTTVDASSLNVPFTESIRTMSRQNTSEPMPQIIDNYYLSELHPPLKSTAGNRPTNERKAKFDVSIRRDTECGKGGWYQDNSLTIVENHISKLDQLDSTSLALKDRFRPVDSSATDDYTEKGKIILENIDVRWRMYAGLDWSKPRKESKCNSYLQGRDKSKCLELALSGLDVQYGMYPDAEITVSKVYASVQDFHIYDRSRDAPWKMVLGYYASKHYPRESCAKAFKLDLEAVRPDPLTPIEDYRLHLELLPMRLHLDQGQLNFLIDFFGNGSSSGECPSLPNDEGDLDMSGRGSRMFGSQTIVEEALLPFFQKFDVKPLVVCVDYIPRHIDLAALRRGDYTELLNLVPWKGIELQLKDVCAVGVYGWGSVCETVLGQWLEDISQNQVHKLLKGLAPIRSLYAIGSGTSKLVSLPVKSYKKDKRFLKGVQRGATAFLRSISLEAVGLGVHLAAGAHEVLVQTEYILTSPPPSVSERSKPRTRVRSNQPEDAHQGIHQAYESLSDGLGRTASALIGTPLKVYQRGAGAGSALATAVRAAPAAAIAPVAASARAVHCTLLGVRNSLDPEHRRESREKYLGPSQS